MGWQDLLDAQRYKHFFNAPALKNQHASGTWKQTGLLTSLKRNGGIQTNDLCQCVTEVGVF